MYKQWMHYSTWGTPRWKTALKRQKLSQPARIGMEKGFIKIGETFFDYGSGRGDDVDNLLCNGVIASGYDGYYCPNRPIFEAYTVQLAFVLNVIEDESERREVLQMCYAIATHHLIVAVQSENKSKERVGSQHTSIGTFQIYYDNHDLRKFCESCLGCRTEIQTLGSGILAISHR